MIKKVLNKLGIYRTYKIKVAEKLFKVPIFNKLGFANLKLAEPWMQTVLNKLGFDDAHFLDVGVNVGQTLMRWKAEFPDSKYIGIEPNTDCVYYVNKLIEENTIKNAVILPIALGNSQALNYLYVNVNDPSDSSATTIIDFRENEDRKGMPIITFPFNLLKNNKFDVIKIDVEGAELEVIESIFLSKNCDATFICEVLPVYNIDNHKRLDRQKKIEAILSRNNYSIFRLIKNNNIHLEELSDFGIHSDLEKCDYIFAPSNSIDEIKSKFN